MEKELPKGWVETTIIDVALIKGGKRLPKGKSLTLTNTGYPYIRVTDFNNHGSVDLEKIKYVTKEIFDVISNYTITSNDLYVSVAGTIGKSGIIPKELNGANLTENAAKIVIPNQKVNQKFLYYFTQGQSFKKQTGLAVRAVAMPKLALKRLGAVHFPLPPLPEQQRIVAKLDQLFGHLDSLKTKLERIPQLMADFRQSVLTQAVTGKLTAEWREGRALEEWKKQKISDFTTKVGSGSTPRGGQSAYKSEGIPLIRSMNIRFWGIKYEGLAFIDDVQALKLKNVEVKENDVLLNITGASIGRVCLAPKELEGGRVNQHVSIIRTKENVLPVYLNIYMSSPKIQDYIFKENYGVTRQALTKTQLLNLEISIPAIIEQHQIVQQVESLFAKASAIEERYQLLKSKIEDLPQAILAKAFRGELVAQLPTDGDAAELLAEIQRLRAELKESKKKKPTRRRKS